MSERKATRKMGRPSIYTLELSERICAELACGKSLRTVCKANDMPGLETIFRWLREKPDFREQYEQAKNECADALAEEMIDIADDGRNDWMEVRDKEGENIGWKLNGEHVQRSRLRVDTRKWIASKLKPKKYGDHVDMNHGLQTDDPIAALLRSVQNTALLPVPQKMIENCLADDDEF